MSDFLHYPLGGPLPLPRNPPPPLPTPPPAPSPPAMPFFSTDAYAAVRKAAAEAIEAARDDKNMRADHPAIDWYSLRVGTLQVNSAAPLITLAVEGTAASGAEADDLFRYFRDQIGVRTGYYVEIDFQPPAASAENAKAIELLERIRFAARRGNRRASAAEAYEHIEQLACGELHNLRRPSERP